MTIIVPNTPPMDSNYKENWCVAVLTTALFKFSVVVSRRDVVRESSSSSCGNRKFM